MSTRRILLYCENQRKSEYLKIIWENHFDCEVGCFTNKIQLLKQIKKAQEPIVVFSRDEVAPEYIVSEIQKMPCSCQFIVETQSNVYNFKNNQDVYQITDLMFFIEFEEISKKINLEILEANNYSRINIYQFLQYDEAKTDVYLNLGGGKFVKLISAGELFSRVIIEKYLSKEIKYLYINNEDFNVYIDYLFSNINNVVQRGINSTNIKKEICLSILEVLHYHFTELGISENILATAFSSINNIFQGMSEELSISEFSNHFNSTEYYIEHSLGAAIIGSTILKSMDWKSTHNENDLIMASLLHDIALKNKELSLITSFDVENELMLTNEQLKDYKEHSQNAVKALEKFDFITENALKIIREHHELPDGSGFPQKLDCKTISPLSCIFIISESFYHRLKECNFSRVGTTEAITKIAEYYKDGNFKNPLKALINVFIQGE